MITINPLSTKNIRITSYFFFQKYEKSKCDNTITLPLTPGQNILVYVRVYEPFKYSMQSVSRFTKRNIPMLRLKSVISVLGHQCLTELRDKIICLSDLSISTEISGNPCQKIGKMAKVILFC